MSKISVAVVTKNRFLDLSHCLGSLLSNSALPAEIIVIDNNSSDQTRQLVAGLEKNTKVKIHYENYSEVGYPKIYNRALQLAKQNWVAVIDDDCVANLDWLAEIEKSIKKYPQAAAIMGSCGTYFDKNVYSQATILLDNDWKARSVSGEIVNDLEVLDNKNVVYSKKFLDKHLLSYDEDRISYFHGAAEDCDLGIQIQQVGGEAYFNSKMFVRHKDPQDWLWLMKKTISSWGAYQSLYLKWPIADRAKLKKDSVPLLKLVEEFGKEEKLSQWQKFKLWFVVKQILWLGRYLSYITSLRNL